MLIDAIDIAILARLQKDARISFAELGRSIHLSTPATIDRVHRLENASIITGYHAQVTPSAVGLPLAAIIRVTIEGGRLIRFAKQVSTIPEVLECHRITGAESYILRVAVRDTAHLEQVVDSLMPYVSTNTSLVLASPVLWREITPHQS